MFSEITSLRADEAIGRLQHEGLPAMDAEQIRGAVHAVGCVAIHFEVACGGQARVR